MTAESTGGRTGPVTIRAPRSQGAASWLLTHEQKQLAFRLRGRGCRLVDIAREIGCSAPMVGLMVRDGRFTTGVPDTWEPRPGCLSIADREEILVSIRAGESLSEMARAIGRVPSVVTREVVANGGREGYSAWPPTSGPAKLLGDRSHASSVRATLAPATMCQWRRAI